MFYGSLFLYENTKCIVVGQTEPYFKFISRTDNQEDFELPSIPLDYP